MSAMSIMNMQKRDDKNLKHPPGSLFSAVIADNRRDKSALSQNHAERVCEYVTER